MKNLPLDVKLLKIGLNYANLRAAKEKISHLFVNQHQDQNVEYENLTFIHAKVHEKPPKVHLKSLTFEEILDYDLQTGKFLQNQFQLNPDPSEKIVTNQELTSLDLLNAVVPFTIADATCDLDYHRAHMSENIEAFGQKGADNVKAFINNELKKYHEKGLAAYKLEEPFETDLTQLKVTLGFECIVEGREGKGTDYVYVDSKKLLTKIVAVRH